MVQDFEEIIMVHAWRKKNAMELMYVKRKTFGVAQSKTALACGILEELRGK